MRHSTSLSLLFSTFLFACGGVTAGDASLSTRDLTGGPFDDSAPEVQDRGTAEARAQGFFGGDVISSKLDVERGLSVFEIKILLASGEVIEVALEESTGRLVQIEHESGPLGGDLEVGGGFISLADALATARDHHAGDIVDWELELDVDARWVWEFEYADGTHVKVDAQSNVVVDDHGDDDAWDDRGTDDGQAATPTDEVKVAATAIVDGDIVKSERELEHGMNAWKITIRTASRAEVEVYLLADDASLLRVRDDAGPFDYEVTPGRGWITLGDALDAVGQTEGLERYRLDREGRAFVYELRFSDGDRSEDVRVDATTGAIVGD